MMATTHVLAGVVIGLAAVAVGPVESGLVVLAAGLGGLAPDLDILGAHRKTLHFPVYGSVAAALAILLAALVPTLPTVALTAFLLAAAVHAVSDVFGGGLSLRPWNATSDRGVYEHLRGRWHPPRRVIRYDGAPEDALLAGALAVPSLLALDGVGRWVVVGLVAVSVVYAATRRLLVDGGERLVRRLPPWLLRLVPETLIEDLR
jgi:hypothetical protein